MSKRQEVNKLMKQIEQHEAWLTKYPEVRAKKVENLDRQKKEKQLAIEVLQKEVKRLIHGGEPEADDFNE